MVSQPADQQIRVAIVGAGFMGATHARAARSAGAVVDTVVVREGHSLDTARGAVGARAATTDLAAVLARPEIDVVQICTPNRSHAPLAHPPHPAPPVLRHRCTGNPRNRA